MLLRGHGLPGLPQADSLIWDYRLLTFSSSDYSLELSFRGSIVLPVLKYSEEPRVSAIAAQHFRLFPSNVKVLL